MPAAIAEIQSLQNYAGMASAGSADLPTNGHKDNGSVSKPFATVYKEAVDRERTIRKTTKDRQVYLQEMQETGEILGKEHEIYSVMYEICNRLKPGANPEIVISLSDSFKAFTLKDKKTIVLSAGMFRELEEYVKTKGKDLTADALALIFGHEMTHWDDEAKNIHIGERYCDTQGLKLANKAGYNIDNAVDALEYLEYAEEKAKKDSGLEDEDTISTGEITHPNPEDRRILIQAIANDPNAYLEGRYAKPTTIPSEIYADFMKKADEWLAKARRREMIASEEDIKREFEQAQSLSQVLETFMSSDNFYHADMSREFAQTQEFGNLLLAMAVYGEMTNNVFALLNKEDFIAQFRAGLIQGSSQSQHQAVAGEEISSTRTAQFVTSKNLTAEQIQLIQDCLDGRFENPLQMLLSPQGNFAGFTFNNFFRGIAKDINQFIQPEANMAGYFETKEAQNLDRAGFLGFQEKLDVDSYLGDENNVVSEEVLQQRSDLLDKVNFALASSILRFSRLSRMVPWRGDNFSIDYDLLPWDSRDWNDFIEVSGQLCQDMAAFGPDYIGLQQKVADSLSRSGACSTEEVANRMSLMVVKGGRYLDARGQSNQFLSQSGPDLGDYWVSSPQTHQDLRNALFRNHLSLVQGGQQLGMAFGRPRVDSFISEWNIMMFRLSSNQNSLIGDPLDPYQIIIEGDPSISIPYQDGILDAFRIVAAKKLDPIRWMFDRNRFHNDFDFGADPDLYCESSDPEIIRNLVLNSATNSFGGIGRERRSRIIAAVLNNDQIRTNVPLLRTILEEGVTNHLLSPGEIYQILEKADNFPLYQDFRQYLAENSSGKYYQRAFNHLREQLERQGVPLPEIIARFVESGGVIESVLSPYDSNYGARAIDDDAIGAGWNTSYQAISENPDFTYSQATQLASRIITYTQRLDFPHSETVRQSFLDNAASLIRYSERLAGRLTTSYLARQIEEFGESITSIDDITSRISRMPACDYRDRCLDTVVYTIFFRDNLDNNRVNLYQIRHLFRLYSPQRLNSLDPESRQVPANPLHPLTTLPLRPASFDLREMYPFRRIHEDGFLSKLSLYADFLDEEATVNKLVQAQQAVSHPSSARDYLIERALFPLTAKGSEVLPILQQAYELAHTARTKGSIGRQIAEIRLEQAGINLNFEDGLRIILETMPERSTTRDHLILRVLNSTYTTWSQIHRAEALLLGDDYQTDESASATRSIANEAIGRKIKDMSSEERDELVFFLLDRTKHVLENEDLTEDFFDEKVMNKLRKRVAGIYERTYHNRSYDWYFKKISAKDQTSFSAVFNEQTFDQLADSIKTYLYKRFKGEDTSDTRTLLYQNLSPKHDESTKMLEILDQVSFPEILQMAIPDSLNDFLQDQLGGGNRIISATSLGPMFVTLNPQDRRQLLYRLCLGNNGLFEDRNFSQHGKRILEGFIDLSAKVTIPSVGENQVTQTWDAQEINTVKNVLITAFEALDAGRRTEVFSRIINLIIDSGGSVSKVQIFKTALTAFGVVGAKVGQMDQLLPEYLRDELGSLKEQVPPISKTTIAQVMRASSRDPYYDGLGSVIGAASTATVYLAKRLGSQDEDRVVKVLRPDALKHVDSDLNAIYQVVNNLRQTGILSLDPSQIISELKTMIAEEFNPHNEQRNTDAIAQGRKGLKIKKRVLEILKIKQPEAASKIEVPKIEFASDAHLEMSRVYGYSLARVLEIQAKLAKGETISEEEARYAQVDLKPVFEAVVSDFFQQTFTNGVFHTDLHPGNVLIDAYKSIFEPGFVTEIDHGQVGREPSARKRRALVEYVVGLAINEPQLIAKAINKFSPKLSTEEIQTSLSAQLSENNDLLAATTKFISDHNVLGSINRFTKAMVNIYPFMSRLDEATLRNIITPYIADAVVLFDLEKAIPGMVSEPVKEAVAVKLSPLIDEVSRLERIRHDPALRQAFDAVLKTSIGAATVGADIAYFLGKGETIMGMPVPRSLRPIWKIAKLLSGKDKQARDALVQALHLPSETSQNLREFRMALEKLRQRYAEEKTSYREEKQQIDQSLNDFLGESNE